MSLNINQIRAALTGGGARPGLFRAYITSKIDTKADAKFEFMCKAAQIPGSTLGVIEVPYMARKIKVSGDRNFAEWTVTIINDEDFLVRNMLEGWMQAINGHINNTTNNIATPNPESYKSNAVVQQLSKNGSVLRNYNFSGIWPMDVSAIEVGWEQVDTIEEYSVTFQYDYFTISGTTGDAYGTTTNT